MDKNKSKEQEWLEKLEHTLERLQRERENRKKAREAMEEKRRKLLEQNKIKQEEILRADHEKKERQQKKRMLEERWAMARWVSTYIDENSDRWKKEKYARAMDEKSRAEDWNKMQRLEKIRIIKEKMTDNKTVTVNIRPSKITSQIMTKKVSLKMSATQKVSH